MACTIRERVAEDLASPEASGLVETTGAIRATDRSLPT